MFLLDICLICILEGDAEVGKPGPRSVEQLYSQLMAPIFIRYRNGHMMILENVGTHQRGFF